MTRFLAKVTKLDSGHWIWTGATAGEGRYGAFTLGRVMPAHRAAWILFRGPLPDDGTVVDHLCRTTEHVLSLGGGLEVVGVDRPPPES